MALRNPREQPVPIGQNGCVCEGGREWRKGYRKGGGGREDEVVRGRQGGREGERKRERRGRERGKKERRGRSE